MRIHTIQLARDELVQLEQEGRETEELRGLLAAAEAAVAAGESNAVPLLTEFFEAASKSPQRSGWPYEEPSCLEGIREERSSGPRLMSMPAEAKLKDKILGAWLGRCAGCMLGKPVEGRTREQIEQVLRAAGAWQLDDYFPPLEKVPENVPYPRPESALLRGNITRAVRDDDTDYTVLGLHILEEDGVNFEPKHVALQWLNHFPYHRVYTAERVAYRNFVTEIWPPESARYVNPYREWIGAQIRADAWGYAAPGWPEKAAEMAWRDACISHTKNGIYGEMFFAALIAAAMATEDLREAVEIAAAEVPARCRLREAIDDTVAWCAENSDWPATFELIRTKYGHYHPVHTINNAALVLMGLLHSDGDFGRAISIAVMGGWDTDCNGATAGSVMGAILGASRLPRRWVEPLHDTLESALEGMNVNKVSDLAARTVAVAEQVVQGA